MNWLERFELQGAAREWLKWVGAALMVLDHINTYALAGAHPWMYALGRLAFPIFGVVLAYNMATNPTAERIQRSTIRLLVFALLAQPFSMLLRHATAATAQWWVLNILFTLAAALLLIGLIETTRNALALAAGIVGLVFAGAVVEFHWAGLVFVVASFYLCRLRTRASLLVCAFSLVCLWVENGVPWAFAAIPVFGLAGALHPAAPRARWWTWYAFYPVHLCALWLHLRF